MTDSLPVNNASDHAGTDGRIQLLSGEKGENVQTDCFWESVEEVFDK